VFDQWSDDLERSLHLVLLDIQQHKLLQSVEVIGEVLHDLVEMIDGLVDETVLGEDVRFGEALHRIELARRPARRCRDGRDGPLGLFFVDLELVIVRHVELDDFRFRHIVAETEVLVDIRRACPIARPDRTFDLGQALPEQGVGRLLPEELRVQASGRFLLARTEMAVRQRCLESEDHLRVA